MQKLYPLLPPGNAQRKALAYTDEIHRLRVEGYTLRAIREALSVAGVQVSLSTVRREAVRQQKSPAGGASALPNGPLQPSTLALAPAVAAAPSVRPGNKLAADPRSPQQIAADFMKEVNTNPLLDPTTKE